MRPGPTAVMSAAVSTSRSRRRSNERTPADEIVDGARIVGVALERRHAEEQVPADQPDHGLDLVRREVQPSGDLAPDFGAFLRVIAAPPLRDIVQQQREIEHIAHPQLMNERAGERQLVGIVAPLDRAEHANGADAVLVHRVDVVEVELSLPHDAAEVRQEAAHHAGLVHHPQDLLGVALVGEDRAEGAVRLRVVAHRCRDQPVALVDQAERGRMNVAAFGLGPAEDGDEARRALAERVLADRRDAPAGDVEPVAEGPRHRSGAVDRSGVEPLSLQHRAEDPRELAHLLRDEEVVLHEPLDGEIAAARPVAHARRDLGLPVEGEAILRPLADDVEVRPDPPQEILRPREAVVLVLAEHAPLHELAEAIDAKEILGDPEQHVEVAQAALAVLHVGLQQIAGIAGTHVALVALAQLGSDELGLGARHQFREKALAERLVERLVAPHVARFEHGGPNRHVLARPAQAICDRTGGVAHREAQVPQHVEQVLDDLLAAAGQLVGMQEENIDVGMGRQIAPAVAPDRDQRKAARSGRIGLGDR